MLNFFIPDSIRISIPLYIKKMMDAMPEIFKEGANIKCVYGTFPGFLWEGGRVAIKNMTIDMHDIETIVKMLNDNGIEYRITATNLLLKKEDLSDEYSNKILQIANNSNMKNSISVASPVLYDYVREKYQNLYIDRSVINFIKDIDTLNREIDCNKYRYVIPYPQLNFDKDLINMSPEKKDHVEILCDSCINDDREKCKRHYEQMSLYALGKIEAIDDIYRTCKGKIRIPCNIKELGDNRDPKIRSEELDYYEKHGFHNFKLTGRGRDEDFNLKNTLYYLLRDSNSKNQIMEDLIYEYKNCICS